MNSNVFLQSYSVNRISRNDLNNHRSFVLWFTGLSGSGKSTLANNLQEDLFRKQVRSYVLDGDNIRLGINKDLDFSETGRKENIRRIAEVAKLMVDAGLVVITGFISPFRSDREMAKEIIGEEFFSEIYIQSPIEVCEKRDVKGLYARARSGEIKQFTGITSPYEPPVNPFLTLNTGEQTIEQCMLLINNAIEDKLKL